MVVRVAVLGGGLQGCCTALALAERGSHVTLFDRNDLLLSRAAVTNEGKIHLGYMYAGDRSLSTARMMIQGALAFAPFFARHLGQEPMTVSEPATYVVHRDSQQDVEEVAGYLARVHALVREAAQAGKGDYFGIDLAAAPRAWSAAERAAEFDPSLARAAIDTHEVAIEPVALARRVRACIAANARVDVRLARTIVAVEDQGGRLNVVTEGCEGAEREDFDHVVNALWDGRIAVNATLGLHPNRPWLHRLKYGVSFRTPPGASLRSVTVVLGPFGEVVRHGDGLTYLTWYPECMQAMSSDAAPPGWEAYPDEPLRTRLISGTMHALGEIVPALRSLDSASMSDVCVKGGVIVAWGETDIDDLASELHRRFEIGVTSAGRFHSIDPGKLTMAPYFAGVCADRIMPVH